MTKPSLHEIAAMPYPASLAAMRKHYNPMWGTDHWTAALDRRRECDG